MHYRALEVAALARGVAAAPQYRLPLGLCGEAARLGLREEVWRTLLPLFCRPRAKAMAATPVGRAPTN